MVYLLQQASAQTAIFPRSDGLALPVGGLVLTLRRGGSEVAIAPLADTSDDPKYYAVALTGMDALQVGEYDYRLASDDVTLSEGVAVVGDYKAPAKAFNSDNKTIEYNG